MLAGLDILTNSRIDCYQKCRRAHRFAYELGVRKEPSEALRIGGAVHLGLDVLKACPNGKCPKCEGRGDPVDSIDMMTGESPPCDTCRGSGLSLHAAWTAIADNYVSLFARCSDAEIALSLEVEREKAMRLVEGWAWRWAETQIQMVATEQAFELPIINPETGRPSMTYKLGGKIDGICRLEDGTLAILEHKTCSEDIGQDADYWALLRLDMQISRYMNAAKEIGHDVQTVLYDVIRKPGISPKLINDLDAEGRKIVLRTDTGERVFNRGGEPRLTGDTKKGWVVQQHRETPAEYGERLIADIYARPDFYYARQEIPRAAFDLDECRQELWDSAKDILATRNSERHYRNTKSCRVPFRCDYWGVCTAGIDLTQELPERFVQLDYVHPELEDTNRANDSATSAAISAQSANEQN